MEHISHALPSEMIFYLLRLIHSQCLIPDYSTKLLPDMLEIVIKWLQVSVSECNRQKSIRLKNPICCLGTWFRATERFVRSFPGRTSSTQRALPRPSLKLEV